MLFLSEKAVMERGNWLRARNEGEGRGRRTKKHIRSPFMLLGGRTRSAQSKQQHPTEQSSPLVNIAAMQFGVTIYSAITVLSSLSSIMDWADHRFDFSILSALGMQMNFYNVKWLSYRKNWLIVYIKQKRGKIRDCMTSGKRKNCNAAFIFIFMLLFVLFDVFCLEPNWVFFRILYNMSPLCGYQRGYCLI